MKKFNTGGTADSADKGANVGGTLGSSMMAKGGGTKENAIFREITTEELDKVRNKVDGFLNPLGYSAKVEKSIGDVLYIIEPSTRKVGTHRSDFFDGMQIIALHDGTFEVSEYMAGKNEDELHIYKETKSLTSALKDLIKGNKRKPIQKWNKGGQININDLDLPVIRSQFEDEEYEFKDGGFTSGFKYTIGGL